MCCFNGDGLAGTPAAGGGEHDKSVVAGLKVYGKGSGELDVSLCIGVASADDLGC